MAFSGPKVLPVLLPCKWRGTAVQTGCVLRYTSEVYCRLCRSSRLRSQEGTALQYLSDKLYWLGVLNITHHLHGAQAEFQWENPTRLSWHSEVAICILRALIDEIVDGIGSIGISEEPCEIQIFKEHQTGGAKKTRRRKTSQEELLRYRKECSTPLLWVCFTPFPSAHLLLAIPF